jgi:hypothetical protein
LQNSKKCYRGWDGIPMVVINSLCSSFEKRLYLHLKVQEQSISKLLGPYGQSHACQEWREGLFQPLGPWTTAENRITYIELHRIAPTWRKIESHLPVRTVDTVKNRWYATFSRREQALIYDMEHKFSVREKCEIMNRFPSYMARNGQFNGISRQFKTDWSGEPSNRWKNW